MVEANNNIPTNPYNDKYSSLIRPIKIYLPSQDKNEDIKEHKYDDFVGRERLMEKLFNWLSDKKKESGSYLVIGFLGMGKTRMEDYESEIQRTDDQPYSEDFLLKISKYKFVVFLNFVLIVAYNKVI